MTNRANMLLTQTTFKPVVARVAECAKNIDNRIYGGSETQIDEMPFTALLSYLSNYLYYAINT